MLRFANDLRVYLYREPVDFRCGLNTLAVLVEESMRLDPACRRRLRVPQS
ncbi:IS66 family insertion sequence element accessory protein TnpB [Paraburkholderia youngii]